MAVGQLDRRLLAVMMADVVAYSRQMEADEAGTIARLAQARAEVIDPLIGRHHGRTVKLMGDGAVVLFESVVDAVQCAVAVQEALAERNGSLPDGERIILRIGVNLGDVALIDGDVYGDGVNVAARLQQMCDPGGAVVAGTAYDHLQGKLDRPLDFLGEQQVKNIARPVRAYRVRLAGEPVARRRLPVRARMRMAAALAVLALAGATTGGWWLWSPSDRGLVSPTSIAVMPFDNLTGDEATGRLADGPTEDIITVLALLPECAVTSPPS